MTICINDLSFETIIGILDFERIHPQTIIVDIEIEYKYSQNNFINYADVVTMVEERINKKHYGLLEDALLDLQNILKNTYTHMTKLCIKITKPNIISHCKVSLSDVWITK